MFGITHKRLLLAKVLPLHFNGHFPGGPGSAGTRKFPFWILIELCVMVMVVTTGAIRHAKLQSRCHHQQTNTELFLQAGCPSCRPTNSVKALKGNASKSIKYEYLYATWHTQKHLHMNTVYKLHFKIHLMLANTSQYKTK